MNRYQHARDACVGVLATAVMMPCLNGCGSPSTRSSPYSPQSESARDPAKAQRLTMDAAEIMDKDPEKAQRMLREALSADLWYGPAHNDLGVIELEQGNWYEAASEFEWARKLMPGHPDPRMNLALTMEKAGRVDEAIANYNSALEVYPNHVPTTQALARLQIRSNRTDERTAGFLREIALAGETSQWREWAQRQMVLAEDHSSGKSPSGQPQSTAPGLKETGATTRQN